MKTDAIKGILALYRDGYNDCEPNRTGKYDLALAELTALIDGCAWEDAAKEKIAALEAELAQYQSAAWIEWGDTAWQRINGGWYVLERDGEDWAIIDRIDEAALTAPPTGDTFGPDDVLNEIRKLSEPEKGRSSCDGKLYMMKRVEGPHGIDMVAVEVKGSMIKEYIALAKAASLACDVMSKALDHGLTQGSADWHQMKKRKAEILAALLETNGKS